MTEKTITVSGKEVKFKASAALPRLYRNMFGRDVLKDMETLEIAVNENDPESSQMPIASLEIFENVAYVMAKHADPSIPQSIDEWLEQFDMFSIYEILPEILELWGANMQTGVEAKKKPGRQTGK